MGEVRFNLVGVDEGIERQHAGLASQLQALFGDEGAFGDMNLDMTLNLSVVITVVPCSVILLRSGDVPTRVGE